ncbi:MAG: VF530 family protein [Gammaproteobacteria bacterium]
MKGKQVNNPLHAITLEQIVNSLVDHYGWEGLGGRIAVRCFTSEPSVKSSLKFLRKTPWARKKVEDLYIATQHSEVIWGGADDNKGSHG